mgnify:CR=1 FL=1
MYGQHHPLAQRTGPTKIAWGLSLPQILTLLAGGCLSYRLSQIVPALPFKNIVFAHLHHLIPLGLAALFIFARHGRTGLNFAVYLYYMTAYRLRRKTFVWRR